MSRHHSRLIARRWQAVRRAVFERDGYRCDGADAPCRFLGGRARGSRSARCSAHDLRHSFASQAAMQGIPLPVLGHAQVQMTLRYVHVSDREVEAAAERIGEVMAGLMTGIARSARGHVLKVALINRRHSVRLWSGKGLARLFIGHL